MAAGPVSDLQKRAWVGSCDPGEAAALQVGFFLAPVFAVFVVEVVRPAQIAKRSTALQSRAVIAPFA
jgi:hypothetical protein